MSVVIVLIMVGVSATLFVLILSWNTSTSRTIDRRGAQADWYAAACGETALAALGVDPSEESTRSFDFTDGSCTILPVSPVTSVSFTIRTEGMSGGHVGRLLVETDLALDASANATVTVLSRKRVIDF